MSPRTLFLSKLIGLYCILIGLSMMTRDDPWTSDRGDGDRPSSEPIVRLNRIIRDWTNYHRYCVASRAFSRVDFEIWCKLWRWCRRRHPTKNAQWVKARYFHAMGGRTWIFAALANSHQAPGCQRLVYADDTWVRRHRKIKGEANPFDPQWRSYFVERVYRQRFGSKPTHRRD